MRTTTSARSGKILKTIVSCAASLALALALVPAAPLPRQAQAASGTAEVSYRVVKDGSYSLISSGLGTSAVDNRDQVSAVVQLGSVIEDAYQAKATFWMRPVGGGSDIKVFSGSSDNYGSACVTFQVDTTIMEEDGTQHQLGSSSIEAQFVLADADSGDLVAPGSYKLVADVQTRYSSRDSWGATSRYVASSAVTVKQGEDAKPLVKSQYLPSAISGDSYNVKLQAEPSVGGHTVVFSEVPNVYKQLADYGLSLSDDGVITGTPTPEYAGELYTTFIKATEMDGDTPVGSTERAMEIHFIDPPYIDSAEVGFSRNDIGIVAGSQVSLQAKLAESSGAKTGTATLHYYDANRVEKTATADLALAEGSTTVFEGACMLPKDAAEVDKVVFDAASMKAREDKTYEVRLDREVAPLFEAQLQGELGEGASSPFLAVETSRGYSLDPIYFEDGALATSALEEGAYTFTLGALVNGEQVLFDATAAEVELAPGAAVAETFDASALVNVKPQVEAPEDLAYSVEWFADAAATTRVGTGLTRGWNGSSALYVRATPRGTDLVAYAPSELVQVTAENADSLELEIAARPTCAVSGMIALPASSLATFDSLRITLTAQLDTGVASTWTADVADDGAYQFEGIPQTGQGAQLIVSGALISTAERSLVLSGDVTENVTLGERQGAIVLPSRVDFVNVTAGGNALASQLSADKTIVYLDDPDAVTTGQELDLEVFCGYSQELYGGGVTTWGHGKTVPLNANKSAAIASWEMEELGGFSAKLLNDHGQIFAAMLVKDMGEGRQSIVRVDTSTERSGVGTSAKEATYTMNSIPAGTYRLLFAERESLLQLSPADRLTPERVQEAIAQYGKNLSLMTDAFTVESGGITEVPDVALPDAQPDAMPVDSDNSNMQVTATGTNLVYRATIAKGEAELPKDKDLNLIIATSQDTRTASANIAGSVVYINGHAATARATVDDDDATEGVYMFPNSLRNSFEGASGMYVVSIPADEVKKYGGFTKDKPLVISFTAPRVATGTVSANASVTFANLNWTSSLVSASGLVKELNSSAHYCAQRSTVVKGTMLTCFAPENVSTASFSVYGTAPVGSGASRSVDVYLDGMKAATVFADASTGRYDAKLTIAKPDDYSKHLVAAQVRDGSETLQSAQSTVVYSPRMAALSTIEVSDYGGSWVLCWKDGYATIGNWYYLPDVKTRYRLSFKKGSAAASAADVSDVYVNVPSGTGTLRLKAVHSSGKYWVTDEVAMGNTPPTGEWVTYNPGIPTAQVAADEATRMAKALNGLGAYTAPDAATVSSVNSSSATTHFSLSADGKTATFEGVDIENTKTTTASAVNAWVDALPSNPWKGSLTDEQKAKLYYYGFTPTYSVEADDSVKNDDARVNGVRPELDTSSTTVYQRSDAVDKGLSGDYAWNLPSGFDKNELHGCVVTDSVSRYAYADGSGYIYTRVTASRNKYAKTICDTKAKTLYTTTYTATAGNTVDETKDDLDGDGAKGTVNDNLYAIGDGWATFQHELVNLSCGVLSQTDSGIGPMSVASAKQKLSASTRKGGSSQLYSWQNPKDPNFVTASSDEVLDAMARWVLVNSRTSGGPEGFDVFCLSGDNGRWSAGVGEKYDWMNDSYTVDSYTVRSGIDQRVLTYIGASKTKQLEKEVAKEAAKLAAGQVVDGDVVDAAADVIDTASNVYAQHTSMSERDAQIEDLRRELYYAAYRYNKLHPDTPLNMEGFPFGANLPDPRQKQDEKGKKMTEEEILKMIEEWDKEDTKDWPSFEDYERKWQEQLAELEANSVKNVPSSDSNVPVIDPSGYVYAGTEDNRIEGAVATLFEVADDGTRAQWDADAYGQNNPYTTDEQGQYEWFVPEGKWSITFAKEGYLPYTTGENDGIDTAQAGDTWYMPVAPAQLDVNINLTPAASPEVKSVTWTKKGVEVLFTQVMDESSLDGAFTWTRDGMGYAFDLDCSTVKLEADDGASPLVTKATLKPAEDPTDENTFSLEVRQTAANYAGTKLKASYSSKFIASAQALKASDAQQVKASLQQTLDGAANAMAGVAVSSDGSDVAASAKWALSASFEALDAAVAAARAVLENDASTEKEMSAAENSLMDAIAKFQAACKPGTKADENGAQGGNGGNGTGATSGGSAAPAASVKAGASYSVGSGASASYYKVKKVASAKTAGEVWFLRPKAPKKVKSVSIPATVKIGGVAYNVTGIEAKALSKCAKLKKATVGAKVKTVGKNVFKGSKKLKKITIATKLLNKKSCKNLVKGSKITSVKLKGAAKKAKKKYKKWFPKKNAGKKLSVK